MIIYKITNKINNKIYIGKTISDKEDYFGSGILIKRAIEKYGIENFSKEIIDNTDNINDLNIKEKDWIEFYNSRDPKIGYNIGKGGDGGDIFTNNPNKEEIRKKYSKPGKKNGMYGKKHSKETKEKISKLNKGKRKGIKTWNYGLSLDKDYTEKQKEGFKKSIRLGKNNNNSWKYSIISPENKIYEIFGGTELKNFSKENNFFLSTLRYFCNKGIIPEPSRKATIQRKNMTGWEIKSYKWNNND